MDNFSQEINVKNLENLENSQLRPNKNLENRTFEPGKTWKNLENDPRKSVATLINQLIFMSWKIKYCHINFTTMEVNIAAYMCGIKY